MNNISITSAIDTFLNSNEKGLQLDFFRKNGQVLLQVFKGYDVEGWDIDLVLPDEDSVVIELHFHKNKTDNKANLDQFMQSGFFNEFEKVDLKDQDNAFFSIVIHNQDGEALEDKLHNIIAEIYSLDGEEVGFTLNAY